jgi:hypothetical protein
VQKILFRLGELLMVERDPRCYEVSLFRYRGVWRVLILWDTYYTWGIGFSAHDGRCLTLGRLVVAF